MTQTQTIENLEFIIRNYTTIFIVFDILFVTMIFVGVLLLIRFLKSKKSLQDSNEYLLYTIHGQEEEKERIAIKKRYKSVINDEILNSLFLRAKIHVERTIRIPHIL